MEIPRFACIDITHEAFRTEHHLPRFIVMREVTGKYLPQSVNEILFASDILAEVQERARQLNQESFDQNILGRTFTCYRTAWYTCIDEEDARLSASIDKTLWENVKITHGLEILHADREFTYWSNGKFSKPVSYLPHGGQLSPAAIKLIRTVRGADGGYVDGPDGMRLLAKVAEILEEKELSIGPSRGLYARERVEKIRVRWIDGTEGDLYAHTAGYFEGYQYNIYLSLDAFMRAYQPAPDASGITSFSPDDFHYDPDLGFVSNED